MTDYCLFITCHSLTRKVFSRKPLHMTLAEAGFLIVENNAVEQMPHSVGTGTDIVGMDVNGAFASGFLKARACAGHDGGADSEGFDDRKSETLVTRRVQRHFGTHTMPGGRSRAHSANA